MNTVNKPYIRICKEHRSCNCCDGQNYRSNPPSPKGRLVDEIYEVVASHMVIALCPDCLRSLVSTALTMLTGQSADIVLLKAPEPDETIRILVRDCNGKRDTLEFSNPAAVYHWAETEMTDDDEILVITQGDVCLYSGLQADPRLTLTADDLTGFFG